MVKILNKTKNYMIIGLIYGGTGAEELTNICAIKYIERVLHFYNIKTQRIYLNEKIYLSDIKDIEIFFVIDSNCRNYSQRNFLFGHILKSNKCIIIQDQKAFELAKDKYKTNVIFSKAGFNIPVSFLIDTKKMSSNIDIIMEKYNDFIRKVGFPIIIKNNFGSSSEYLNICFDKEEMRESLENLSKFCTKLLVEEYIPGKEITSPFVQLFNKNIVLNSLEIIYDGYIYDYKIKNKTFRNKLKIPPRLSKTTLRKIKMMTNKARQLIGCHFYCRLDMRINKNGVYILEINSEPVLSKNDFLARSAKSIGISYPKLIIGLLSNMDFFIRYARIHNKKLFNFIVSSQNFINKLS